MVEWYNIHPITTRALDLILCRPSLAALSARRLFVTRQWFKSFKAQTFDPPSLKCGVKVQRDGGLKIKKNNGEYFLFSSD